MPFGIRSMFVQFRVHFLELLTPHDLSSTFWFPRPSLPCCAVLCRFMSTFNSKAIEQEDRNRKKSNGGLPHPLEPTASLIREEASPPSTFYVPIGSAATAVAVTAVSTTAAVTVAWGSGHERTEKRKK